MDELDAIYLEQDMDEFFRLMAQASMKEQTKFWEGRPKTNHETDGEGFYHEVPSAEEY